MPQKIPNKYFLLICITFLCLALVVTLRHRQSGVYRGRFTDGFETSRFVPCGSSEKWWVEGNKQPIYEEFYPDIARSGLPGEHPNIRFETGYVEMQGRVTWHGTYGHEGEYNREIYIDQVLRVQSEIPGSCK